MSLYRFLLATLTAGVLLTTGCETTVEDMNEPPPDPSIRLVGQLAVAPAGMIHTDVWGYVDAATGKEYALVGGQGGGQTALFVVDVSAPATPVLVATVNDVPGFDVKVWGHYAYTVTGGGDRRGVEEGRIIDLSDPANPVVAGTFPSSHNLFIDDQGFMYLEVPGLRIFDLNTDATTPELLWEDDGMQGHDATVIGDRLYDFHGRGGTRIYDVSDRAAPQLLGAVTLPSIRYHHSGWTTQDDRYLLICDELALSTGADITIMDIQNPAEPTPVAEIADSTATVHNLYVIDNLAYVSYYTAGFRLYDLAEPTAPRLLDEFDTAPDIEAPGFAGAWGVYPFTPSGHIYVSDMTGGLHVFALER